MANSAQATFEVADHFEITGRGIVVLGRILSGVFRVGMRATGVQGFAPLTIAGVEAVRGTNPKISIGIVFRDHNGLSSLRVQFPTGSLLVAQDWG